MNGVLSARRSLVLAGFVVAAGIASVAVCVLLLRGGPGWPVVVALCAAPLIVAVAAGFSHRARRASMLVLVAAADFAGLAVAVDLGLLLTLLVFGRLPVGGQVELVNAALLGMLLVATLAGPLGRRAGRSARAALAGIRRSPDELLADLGDRAAQGTPVDELLRQLAEAMRREWRVTSVRIWWAGDGDAASDSGLPHQVVVPAGAAGPDGPIESVELPVLARAGVAGAGWLRAWLPRLLPTGGGPLPQIRIAPATYGDQVLGLVMVDRPADVSAFTAAEERGLAEVARRLGIVLRNRALDEALRTTLADLRRSNAALQASRTRLVTTADAERKRIERDLHDGAQQHLVAIAVGLRLLRDTPDGTPDTELLDELDLGIRDAIAALRVLAHGIYPPLLRDAGLAEALRAAAKRSPLDVAVQAGELGDLGEPVQAAVYFCCLEALQNAAKHAPGSAVTVTLLRDCDGTGAADRPNSGEARNGGGAPDGGVLRFEVRDDGPGFDVASAASGAGVANMSDRLGALGGALQLRSTPGQGTTVVGDLPLGRPGPARP